MNSGALLRRFDASEIPQAVALHLASFPGFYLSLLGPRFLARYYGHVLAYPRGIPLGAFAGGRLVGMAAGFVDPPSFYRQLKASRLRFALAALPSLALSPRLVRRFLVNYRRASAAASQPADHERGAELASLAVHPTYAGRGLGGQLVRAFLSEAHSQGAEFAMLTSDAEGNDAVNRFYRQQGFQVVRRFEAQPGRLMNEYVLRLDAAPPEPAASPERGDADDARAAGNRRGSR